MSASAIVICSRAAARQPQPGEPGARLGAEQPAARRRAVVIEHGLHALLPLAALVDERVAQPDAGAQVEQVLGRDPRLRQPPDHQQLAQVAGVGAVALGALLGPAARRGLRRLGEMHLARRSPAAPRRRTASRSSPPARPRARGRGSGRRTAHAGAVGRRDPLARDLAGRRVDPLGGDLRSVLVESHYDRHSGPPHAPRSKRLRGPRSALELRRSLHVRQDGPRHMPSMSMNDGLRASWRSAMRSG